MNNSEALEITIDHLQDNWFEPDTGIVAASLVHPKGIVSATSRYIPQINKWSHAESVVLDAYRSKYGRVPEFGSTMIVTLSPCVLSQANRVGPPCSDKIVSAGVTSVAYGYLDSIQKGTTKHYDEIGLKTELVGDAESQKICAQLFTLFGDLYNEDGRFHYLLATLPNPWAHIKHLIGIEPFRV